MKLKSINPSTGELLGEVKVSTQKDIESAVKKAHHAKKFWRNIGVTDRIKVLTSVYKLLEKHQDEIAHKDSQEMGFPISQCLELNLGDGLNYFKWYLDNAEELLSPEVTYEDDKSVHQIFHEPYGVAAVIQPWNFPFCQWSWSVVPTLLTGNTVVYKSSEEVPLTNQYLESLINQTNIPTGILNFIYGDGQVGDYLVHQNIDLIVFTGSTKTGQYLYRIAADKFIPALLELGGSAPGIVFKDTDLGSALESIFWLRFTNCGQTCDGLKRLIVHQSIFDNVVTQLALKLKNSPIGDPFNQETIFGPLVAQRQLDLLEAQVKDALQKGAKLITGGQRPDYLPGFFYQPAILTNIRSNMRVWQEEVFGPVLPIISFNSDHEAIALANDTIHGLGSYIYTADLDKARKFASQIQAGMVSINGTNYVIPQNPFGGYKKSGLGRAHGTHGLHELCQIKVISQPKKSS